jgi:hypothetical protein
MLKLNTVTDLEALHTNNVKEGLHRKARGCGTTLPRSLI